MGGCGGKKQTKKPEGQDAYRVIPNEGIVAKNGDDSVRKIEELMHQSAKKQEVIEVHHPPPLEAHHEVVHQVAHDTQEIQDEKEQEMLLDRARQMSDNNHQVTQQSFLYKHQDPVFFHPKTKNDMDGPFYLSVLEQPILNGSSKPLFKMSEGIMIANVADMTQRIFFAKGINNANTYRIFIQDRRYMMKNFAFCHDLVHLQLMDVYKKQTFVAHANLRKIQAFLVEKVNNYYNVGVISEYQHHNVYSFAAQTNVTLRDRFKVARDIVRGLLHLHADAIILGNLKPSNILIDLEYKAQITDWELSHTRATQLDRKHVDLIPVYTAPEIYLNKIAEYTAAADVWSLGYIFFLLFFQIDLAVDNHRLGLMGKAQCPYFNNFNVYTKDGLMFDSNKLSLPQHMEGCSQAYIMGIITLIQSMTYTDPRKRIQITSLLAQLQQVENSSIDREDTARQVR